MKKSFIYNTLMITVLFSFCSLLNSLHNPLSYQLISHSQTNLKELSSNENLSTFSNREALISYKEVVVNSKLRDDNYVNIGDTVVLNLFDDNYYTGIVKSVNTNINNTTAIRGKISGFHYSYFIISTTNELSLVSINIPETREYYMIKPEINSRKHYLVKMDRSLMDIIRSESPVLSLEDSTNLRTMGKNHFDSREDEVVNVDVMIIYTPSASNWAFYNAGGIENVISQSMEKCIITLENSNTLMTMTLVHSAEVDYTESGDPSVDLMRFTASPNFIPGGEDYYNGFYIPGFMEEVHVWRDIYGADLVALLADDPGAGGMAWLLSSIEGYPDLAFSLTRVQQAHTSFTFIHELGHNMGAHHHKDQNFQPGPTIWLDWPNNVWSAGWRWTVEDLGHFCSVMSYTQGYFYDDGIDHVEVAYFSNPDINHYNVPTGHPVDGNNASTIRELRYLIASYRPSSDSPANLIATYNDQTMELNWEQPQDYLPLGYNIYRNGEIVNSYPVEETTFTEVITNYTDIVTYYVTALYTESESYPSNTVEIDFYFNSGSGTEISPYHIASVEQLNHLHNYLNRSDIHFILVSDLDFSESHNLKGNFNTNNSNWKPLGTSIHNSFRGHFNGDGYTINGIYIDNSDENNQAFFGYIWDSVINGLELTNIYVDGKDNVGGIAGYSHNSIISFCNVYGVINGRDNVGGVIGNTDNSTIKYSSASGNINGVNYIGGITGNGSWSNPNYANIYRCLSNVNINGNNFLGGIIGRGYSAKLSLGFSRGSITGTGGLGGIAGFTANSIISYCHSAIDLSGNTVIGGLFGYLNNSELYESYSIGQVIGNNNTGGLVGHNLNSEVFNSYWNMETSGQSDSFGGEGRTTIDMVYPYSDNTYVNWDFSEIWSDDEDHNFNYGYPYLADITVHSHDETLPTEKPLLILKNYPNPFNPDTKIFYNVINPGKVVINIFNIKGQKINTIVSEFHTPGDYQVIWNGNDENLTPVSSGIYFINMATEHGTLNRKILLLK